MNFFRLKIAMKVVAVALLSVSLLACSREGYVYVEKMAGVTDRTFPIREMGASNMVDVLWVIDNSGSMGPFQQQVIANAQVFMQEFIQKRLNWKMGIISTDSYDQPYVGFPGKAPLDSTIADPVGTLIQTVRQLGTSGSGYEATFGPITTKLRGNPQFLRNDTPLAVIMVTDAPEQSNMPFPQFDKELRALTGNRDVFAYGVLGASDFGCQSEEGFWEYKNSVYEKFIQSATAGKAFPLCKDFGTSLADIANDIVTRVSHLAIYLDGRPDTSTLQVFYQGKPLPAGSKEQGGYWKYDFRLNAVIFNDLDFSQNDRDAVRIVFEEQK